MLRRPSAQEDALLSNLGADALQKAIKDYMEKQGRSLPDNEAGGETS